MLGHCPAAPTALANVDRGQTGARHAMGQDRGAAEPRAHDAPVAEGRRHAVNHDTAPTSAGHLNLKVKAAASPNVLNGNSRCALFAFMGRAPYRSAARIPVPVASPTAVQAECASPILSRCSAGTVGCDATVGWGSIG